jgi:hypothetical protein
LLGRDGIASLQSPSPSELTSSSRIRLRHSKRLLARRHVSALFRFLRTRLRAPPRELLSTALWRHRRQRGWCQRRDSCRRSAVARADRSNRIDRGEQQPFNQSPELSAFIVDFRSPSRAALEPERRPKRTCAEPIDRQRFPATLESGSSTARRRHGWREGRSQRPFNSSAPGTRAVRYKGRTSAAQPGELPGEEGAFASSSVFLQERDRMRPRTVTDRQLAMALNRHGTPLWNLFGQAVRGRHFR